MSKHFWSPIEEHDEFDVVKAVHIMPVVMTDGFKTEQEAWDFLEKVEATGCPCLTDEDDNIICTYFGHIVSSNCPCSPELHSESLLPTYYHHIPQ